VQIDLEQMTKEYGPRIAALKDLDLSIGRGERITVLGPSGSGKTTLLRLIAGLESPDSGTLRIGGRDMRGVPPHCREVAMVFQNPALYPHLSVRDNLAFGLKARGVARRPRRERAAELAMVLGLEGLLDRRPAALSGGERQRVALGRALAGRPAVLLLDEPFSSLDEPLRAELRAKLIEVHRRFSATMVHVTHDQQEALALGQRVAVLREGRLVQFDRPEEVHDRPADRFVASFVGSPGMNLLDCELVVGAGFLEIRLLADGSPLAQRLPDEPIGQSIPLDRPRRVVLGFRPEHLGLNGTRLAPSPSGLVIPAHVVATEFQGHSKLVALRMGPTQFQARVSVGTSLAPGQSVEAEIDLTRACLFDSETGRRLKPDCQARPDSIA
jgi:ABC-type sugar transport system ATPase subunit